MWIETNICTSKQGLKIFILHLQCSDAMGNFPTGLSSEQWCKQVIWWVISQQFNKDQDNYTSKGSFQIRGAACGSSIWSSLKRIAHTQLACQDRRPCFFFITGRRPAVVSCQQADGLARWLSQASRLLRSSFNKSCTDSTVHDQLSSVLYWLHTLAVWAMIISSADRASYI
jgi:hypothetical protein